MFLTLGGVEGPHYELVVEALTDLRSKRNQVGKEGTCTWETVLRGFVG